MVSSVVINTITLQISEWGKKRKEIVIVTDGYSPLKLLFLQLEILRRPFIKKISAVV